MNYQTLFHSYGTVLHFHKGSSFSSTLAIFFFCYYYYYSHSSISFTCSIRCEMYLIVSFCFVCGVFHHQLPELIQTHVHWVSDVIQPSNHLILCHPLLLLNLSQLRGLFQWVVLRVRWPKYWSFSFSINPSNEYSRLISFRIDWFDLLALQGTVKSCLQHHS